MPSPSISFIDKSGHTISHPVADTLERFSPCAVSLQASESSGMPSPSISGKSIHPSIGLLSFVEFTASKGHLSAPSPIGLRVLFRPSLSMSISQTSPPLKPGTSSPSKSSCPAFQIMGQLSRELIIPSLSTS